MQKEAIPFVEYERIEARTTKIVPLSLEEAWRQEIERMPNLAEEERKKAVSP